MLIGHSNVSLLPDTNHVARHVQPGALDEDQRPGPAAFQPRETEPYLSVQWVEHFGSISDRETVIPLVRQALGRQRTIRKSHKIAVLNIGESKRHVTKNSDRRIRFEHLPIEPDDLGHAGIFGIDSLYIAELLTEKIVDVWDGR
jgi:hypothetical protein